MRVTHITYMLYCMYVAPETHSYDTMLWIMGDVVNADQFESVTIFDRCYEYGYAHTLHPNAYSFFHTFYRTLSSECHPYLLYNMWVRKQCLQMEPNDNANGQSSYIL